MLDDVFLTMESINALVWALEKNAFAVKRGRENAFSRRCDVNDLTNAGFFKKLSILS